MKPNWTNKTAKFFIFCRPTHLILFKKMDRVVAKNSGVVWLIDAAYVFKGTNNKIDYFDLKDKLCRWLKISHFDQIIFYNSYSPDNDNQRARPFLDILEKRGFQIKLFPLSVKNREYIQKGVDVALCTDLLCMAFKGQFKKCIISGGDKDFVPAIKQVRSMWREVYLSGYRNSMAKEMVENTEGVYWMK